MTGGQVGRELHPVKPGQSYATRVAWLCPCQVTTGGILINDYNVENDAGMRVHARENLPDHPPVHPPSLPTPHLAKRLEEHKPAHQCESTSPQKRVMSDNLTCTPPATYGSLNNPAQPLAHRWSRSHR